MYSRVDIPIYPNSTSHVKDSRLAYVIAFENIHFRHRHHIMGIVFLRSKDTEFWVLINRMYLMLLKTIYGRYSCIININVTDFISLIIITIRNETEYPLPYRANRTNADLWAKACIRFSLF